MKFRRGVLKFYVKNNIYFYFTHDCVDIFRQVIILIEFIMVMYNLPSDQRVRVSLRLLLHKGIIFFI